MKIVLLIVAIIIFAAAVYAIFAQKDVPAYDLIDGMDYLDPNVTNLQVGTSATPSLDIRLPNDGAEYAVGMVAVDTQGYYGAMGVFIGNINAVPNKPSIIIRKKP